MRLLPEEKKEELRNAALALILFCLPIAALYYFAEDHLKTKVAKAKASEAQSETVLLKNRAEIEEIRIIQGNQGEIEATWALLNQWNQGAIQQESANVLTEAGFHTVVPVLGQGQETPQPRPGIPQRPQRPGQRPRGGNPGEYTQIQGKSEKSEFLRILTALSKIEEAEGLTQVERAILQLPPDVPPYQNAPTYLDIDLILATPNAIR